MAVPPTIPTSFVPKQPVPQTRRAFTGGTSVVLVASLFILGLIALGAGATFGGELYLKNVRDSKAAELAAAEAALNENTVQEFVRLRDRFNAAEILISNHVSFSQFFETLEALTLQSVRFTSMSAIVEDNRTVKVEMTGTARNFNALAAESAAFAGEKRIKRAIFSGIALNESGGLTFRLSAELDPRLIIMEPGDAPVAPAPVEPVATTTVPTTAPAPAATSSIPARGAGATTTTP